MHMSGKQNSGRSTWVDPDDAPELTAKHFERADWYDGERLIRRGRPPTDNAKQMLSLRVDRDTVERLRRSGPGWQTRAASALKKLAKRSRVAINRREV
jgi:uncharacterized protein (DUF4415 family)